jgi:hypothetical protein
MNNDISKTGLPVTHDEKSNIETMEQGNKPAAFPGAGAASRGNWTFVARSLLSSIS